MEKRSSYKIKLESFKLPRSLFSRLEIFMVLMELLVVSFKWKFFFELQWYFGMVVFLEGPLILSNVYTYDENKIFETIESREPRGNVDYPFGLKRLFSCINIADTFLA